MGMQVPSDGLKQLDCSIRLAPLTGRRQTWMHWTGGEGGADGGEGGEGGHGGGEGGGGEGGGAGGGEGGGGEGAAVPETTTTQAKSKAVTRMLAQAGPATAGKK